MSHNPIQCPYCGQPHPANARFCPATGQILPLSFLQSSIPIWIWFAVGVTVFVLIGVGSWRFLKPQSQEPSATLASVSMITPAPTPTTTSPAVAPVSEPTSTSYVPPTAPLESGNIKVVSDLPMTGSSLGQTQTIVNAITMAFEEKGNKVCGGRYTIEYQAFDDASATLGRWDPDIVVQNAKIYVADTSIVAVIGTFNSGAAKLMIPILNPENLVMISPSNTYPGLTKPGLGEEGEPYNYFPTGQRNYTRVVSADDVQGVIAAQWAKKLGVTSVFILDDQELYGRNIANMFNSTARQIGLNVLGHEGIDGRAADYLLLANRIKALNPGLIYFGGITQNNPGQLFKDIRNAGYTGLLIGSDGIFEQAFLEIAGNAAEGVYVTYGGVPPEQLTGRAAEWRAAYQAKFGSNPEVYTVYGYVAATMLLDAFERVCQSGGSPMDRQAVRDAVFAIQNFDSVLGPFSIDENGDTTLSLMSGSQVRNNRFEFVALLP